MGGRFIDTLNKVRRFVNFISHKLGRNIDYLFDVHLSGHFDYLLDDNFTRYFDYLLDDNFTRYFDYLFDDLLNDYLLRQLISIFKRVRG